MNNFKDIFNYMKKVNLNYGSDSLSVNEVMKLPVFKNCEILGGHLGLNNSCKHMTILETPEGIRWLEGGEFLLTAGYAFYKNEELKENMIIEAFNNGVSAIGIKENRYFGKINNQIIKDANKYKIPLIKVPYYVVYTDTISSFYDLLFYRKNEYILNLNSIYEKLLDLTFENKDINGIINSLSNITNSNVFLFDDEFNIISRNIINDKNHKNIINFFPFNKNGKKFLEDTTIDYMNFKANGFLFSSFSIIRNNKKVAFLYLIKSSELDRTHQSAIEYGISLLSMKLEKQWLIKISKNKFNKTLVEMMLNNKDLPKEFFDNVEKDLGWDKRGGFTGVCIKISEDRNKNYSKLIKDIYTEISNCIGEHNYLTTDRYSEIFIFFKLQESTYLKDIINNINSSIDRIKYKNSISIGVSNIYNNLSEIERLYNESYLAAVFSNSGITYYHLLDTMKLLYPLKDDKEIKLYYEKTIKKLNDYDTDNGMSLLNTLEIYFENNMNKKEAASKLFIHVETLRYRLSRIEEITGYSVSDSEGIFALKMGLKLQKIMNLK